MLFDQLLFSSKLKDDFSLLQDVALVTLQSTKQSNQEFYDLVWIACNIWICLWIDRKKRSEKSNSAGPTPKVPGNLR